ncbi:MAG: glutamyl-tRNA amidotransferase [Candidatus Omnitrophica bacterium CG08_land_8_20_14_0_20_41_16]|uniref:Glutamyl-tRNA amidotransferase n=1 Tax=Candidatus Sherwoodlollariibacterium unditelluris TaxID=1974757 RepID=A0A2G9YJI5_9BACT|nr:MAG: glutamyl-tRNA amidotransferase [Candidatus Omnitrophica bacterium CG23_combo_of_CG06-09_8_20_14_all_41_10]PIS33852.1 MAG: glutamyl-tRNA amidotransferase [Candidatus Omnitrophica bacterium CG08_land_8_20_14_0_20_41_16]
MLEEKLLNDYKEAMKAKDTLKSSVFSFLRAEMINLATAKKKNKLDDYEVVFVIRKQVRQRQDSIEQFTTGGRLEIAEKEREEMEVLKGYLPPELSADEIKKIIEEVVAAAGACGIKDMGRVMKEVNAKIAGQADGRLVSDLVRERLSGKD